MTLNKELLAPCGLYCGVCGIQAAYREDNQRLKEKLAGVYGMKPEDIKCRGCMSDLVFKYCQVCPIRKCAQAKNFQGCFQCAEFPCQHVNNFPFPAGKQEILAAVPEWKKLGTDKWVESQEKKYLCPKCHARTFRGAKRCPKCKEPLGSNLNI